MQTFKPATSLETYSDSDVNQSLNIVGEIRYWHPGKFKHLCRDMHAANYHLYSALGKYLLRRGLIPENGYEEFTPIDYIRMLLAIVDFLPDDFIPHEMAGSDIHARDYDWRPELIACGDS